MQAWKAIYQERHGFRMESIVEGPVNHLLRLIFFISFLDFWRSSCAYHSAPISILKGMQYSISNK